MIAIEKAKLAWLELAVGLVVAGAGIIHTVWALPAELSELRPSAHHGLALLGGLIVLRAIAEIGVNVNWVGGFGTGLRHRVWARFRALAADRRVEAVVGALVIVAGLGEAYQVAVVGANTVYHWGVILIGLMMFCRATFGLVEGLEHLEHAGVVHRSAWGRRVAAVAHHPAVVIGLAVALFVLAGAELLLPDPAPAEGRGEAGAPVAAHGMAMLAGLHLLRGLKDLGQGAQLIWATVHAEPSGPDHEYPSAPLG